MTEADLNAKLEQLKDEIEDAEIKINILRIRVNVKEALEKQIQLLSELSEKNHFPEEVGRMSLAMCEIADRLLNL